MTNKTIKVDYLSRVEGEGALYIKVKDNKVSDVKLKIIEPPRFFEAFLRGRKYTEAPDITARICGICPVAYQMSTVHAIEQAFGVTCRGAASRITDDSSIVANGSRAMFYMYICSMLQIFLAIKMQCRWLRIIQIVVKRGLQMKKAGNAIVSLLGGREVHPINVRVGGFYKAPSKQELGQLAEKLKWGRDAALETVLWTAQLPFPDFEQDYEFVALRHPTEYPFNEGRLVSNKGLDIAVQEYENHFVEEHIEYSNALHSVLKERGAYFVGPLARYNLNFDRLSPLAHGSCKKCWS